MTTLPAWLMLMATITPSPSACNCPTNGSCIYTQCKYSSPIGSANRGTKMNVSNRMEWTIKQTSAWVATHNETGCTLVARSLAALMSKINEWENV